MTGPTATLDATTLRRRFLLLTVLRWLPTGLLVPVVVLLLVDRGLTLAQVGVAASLQAVVVLLLELPTGGLADAVGRRQVLVGASVVELAAVGLFAVADGLPAFALAFGLFGVYRALESGPLESWFVDRAQAIDGAADLEGALARRGVALGLALAVGSLASSGLVQLARSAGGPAIDPLVLPVLVALGLRVVDVGALWLLVDERGTRSAPGARPVSVAERVRRVPTVVGQAVRLVRGSRVLRALVAVELCWGAGMVAFESLTPVRLADLLGSTAAGAGLYGPASAAGWLASAAASAAVPWCTRRFGAHRTAALLRVVQGGTTLGIGLVAGPAVAVVAFVLTMGAHGAANAVHGPLLHRAVDGPAHRATVVSVNSMLAHLGGGLSGIALGALADVDLALAFVAGAVLLAAGAPLYLAAGRAAADGT